MRRTPNRSGIFLVFVAGPAFCLPFLSTGSAEDLSTRVVVYDTHGSAEETQWTKLTGPLRATDPQHVVLQNGLIRIRYPARKADSRSGFNPLSERAAHLLFLNYGGSYQLVQDPNFGDWTYVGGAFDDAPTSFEILKNTAELCTLALSFGDHKMAAADSEQPGAAAPIIKTITLRQGEFGYSAHVRVGSSYKGEREVGFGGTRSHLFNYTASLGQQWRLGENHSERCCNYKFPKPDGSASGDTWAVGFSPTKSYYRLVAISPSGPSATVAFRFAQFRTTDPSNPNTAGSIIHYTRQGLQEYEAYIAAVPYDGSATAVIDQTDQQVIVRVPADGVYSIFSSCPRYDSVDKSFNPGFYALAFRELQLVKGINRIAQKGGRLVKPVVVPISNGATFPVDIAATYERGRIDREPKRPKLVR